MGRESSCCSLLPGRRRPRTPLPLHGTAGDGTLAPGTIEKIYQTFRKVMAAAVDDDRIPKLPCPARPPLARGKRKPVRFLTEAEVSALAGAIDPRYEAAIYLLAYGGFRIGEFAALRIEDVDWERACIHVRRGLTDVGGIIAYENVKTARSFRSVPMADLALEKLAEHIEAFVGRADISALLFPGAKGAPLRPTTGARVTTALPWPPPGSLSCRLMTFAIPRRRSSSPKAPLSGADLHA